MPLPLRKSIRWAQAADSRALDTQRAILRATEDREHHHRHQKTRRVPLVDKESNPVQTAAQAVAELKRLQTQRSDNALPVLERTPKFADYAKRYLDFIKSGQGTKKPGTIEKENTILGRWTDEIGSYVLTRSSESTSTVSSKSE